MQISKDQNSQAMLLQKKFFEEENFNKNNRW